MGSTKSGSTDPSASEWSIVLTDDGEMRQLNATYRGRDETTDVLSFRLADEPGPALPHLGDVVISLEQAARQSSPGGLEPELVRLLVHGYCHLLGYDHQTAAERREMWVRESSLLLGLGVDSALLARD